MKILIHDYAGHPFQAELSRELARRGHTVAHAFFAGDSGPKGRLSRADGDPETLRFLRLGEEIAYSKTNFLMRRAGDRAYGVRMAEEIRKELPDLVVSGNTPTEAQEPIVSACRAADVPFVYWCQDFYSLAVSRILHKKLPLLGHLIGAWYRFLERRQMLRASHVILITEAFREQTVRWRIPEERVSVIPNWGAIEEIDVLDRDTAWARSISLSDEPRIMYTGTLALKHNPECIARLAVEVEGRAQVVLVSAGVGADALRDRQSQLPSLVILPHQNFEVFAEVLGSADVLLAVIEREAGEYSVPSKVLSYLCAGRPIVLAAPESNLAARIVRETGAGTVVEPEDLDGFAKAAVWYLDNPDAARNAGAAGRQYAEHHFPISGVSTRFEEVFRNAIQFDGTGASRADA